MKTYLQKLRDLLQKDINSGLVKPLKKTIFESKKIEDAFRLLASGKHIGKIMIKIEKHDNATIENGEVRLIPRVYCKKELSYVILGGLGGFGLELASWLIGRGCRKLIISSRRGIIKSYQSYRLR